MPSLRLPIVINREIDEALKRVAENTRIPVSTLARDAIIDMLARHGEVVANIPKPGGNRYKSTQDTAEDSTMDQDKSEDSNVGQDTSTIPQNTPAKGKALSSGLSPSEIIRERKRAAQGKGLKQSP